MPETECEFKEWCDALTGESCEDYETVGKDYCFDIERMKRLVAVIKKQYANREELVETLRRHELDVMRECPNMSLEDRRVYSQASMAAQNIVRTHGLEE